MNETLVLELATSVLRVSTPLLLAALGGLLSERAGVVNIALEGLMLLGAFAAAAVTHWTQSPWLGATAGAGAGVFLATLYAGAVIRLRADQIVAGTAINFLAMGLTPFLCKLLFDATGATPAIPLEARFGYELTAVAWASVVALHFALARTPAGLWLRFAGEHPKALDAAGHSVLRVRWTAVMLSGVFAGLGGAALSISLSSSFSREMTAGRGFMALAALIFGKWRPLPTAAACLLFGFVEASQIRLQGVTFWGDQPVPVQWIQILPYVVTMIVLAGFVGQSRPPRALGLPYQH